jgi:uncharacterized membrane protein YhaH (DUF805 family)
MKMTFAGAVQSGLKNYSNFKGTATRTEFWYFYLFNVLLNIVTTTFDSFMVPASTSGMGMGMASGGPLYLITNIALILPNLTIAVRRFHDAGFSGRWIFLYAIPTAAFVLAIVTSGSKLASFNESTGTTEQLLTAAAPFAVSLLLFLAVGIFQLVLNLKATKTAAQGNKYAESSEAATSASE